MLEEKYPRLSIRLPLELKVQIKKLAARHKTSQAGVIRNALHIYIWNTETQEKIIEK
jgi:predicted DNA-binding protein